MCIIVALCKQLTQLPVGVRSATTLTAHIVSERQMEENEYVQLIYGQRRLYPLA